MHFGEELRKIRETKGLTLNQLAMYSGVSSALISRIENGTRGVPKPETIEKLANGLKIPYENLMSIAGYIEENNNLEPLNFEAQKNALIVGELAAKYGIDLSDPIKREQFENIIRIIASNYIDKS
ncbi:helix-turn-helix domain-containing protein [Paenibacillus caseinilyticus]|uniref:Transcriptional regulator n=1 Tax=Paenibacillus mucilaginosus K02 TaxID=997761 RepID=I0BDY2_9BACL|nr:helix-turn-helix transcriptional regulator [Paenibacillus mucilaginosus]AFH60579.1 transcriptional regulator [Paenibacillus mucilaginosus K02]